MVKTYKIKNPQVEAVQWTGQNIEEIEDFCGKENCILLGIPRPISEVEENYWKYNTLQVSNTNTNNTISPSFNDYIIKNLYNEFTAYSPEIFEERFEEI